MPEPDEIQFQCIGCGAMNPAGAVVCMGCGHTFGGLEAGPPLSSSRPRRRTIQEIQGEYRELASPYDPPQARRTDGPGPSIGSFLLSFVASMVLVFLGLAAIVFALILALMIALLALCGGREANNEFVGYMMGTMVFLGLVISMMVFLSRWLRNRNKSEWEKRR